MSNHLYNIYYAKPTDAKLEPKFLKREAFNPLTI